MHFLNGGRLRTRKAIYVPQAGDNEYIEIPVSSVLLRHDQGNVLFDTGCHPSVAQDAEARWGRMAKIIMPVMGPEDNVISSLKSMNVEPSDIDLVVNSHLHTDHCGCNEFFKNATIVVHARELAAVRATDSWKTGYVPADWDHDNPFDLIEGERDLFGDGRLVLLPLPGHTKGSMGALVHLDRDGSFLLASDTVPLRSNLADEAPPLNAVDKDGLLKSWNEVRHVEASGATIICGHDESQWSGLRKGIDGYE